MWKQCSRYCRLRDALDYCKKWDIDLRHFKRVEDLPVLCCSCDHVKSWIRMDAGHFIPRGKGGMSGVYFDERNINAQCKQCNAFKQGNFLGYFTFMLNKYGKEVVDELELLDKTNSCKYKLLGLEIYYKEAYQRLVKEWKDDSKRT